MKIKLVKKYLDEAIEAYEKIFPEVHGDYPPDYKPNYAPFFTAWEKLLRSAVGGKIRRRFLDDVCYLVSSFDKKNKKRIPKEKVYGILEVFGYEIVEEKE